jgi:hypothetical protein
MSNLSRRLLSLLVVALLLLTTQTLAVPQSVASIDFDDRQLLGMAIIALTIVIAFLMVCYLPMNRNYLEREHEKNRNYLEREREKIGDIQQESTSYRPQGGLGRQQNNEGEGYRVRVMWRLSPHR